MVYAKDEESERGGVHQPHIVEGWNAGPTGRAVMTKHDYHHQHHEDIALIGRPCEVGTI